MTASIRELGTATRGRLAGGSPEARWTAAAIDSRAAGRGVVFFALPGTRTDGHRFVAAAARAGATAAVVERGTRRSLGVARSFPLVRVRSVASALRDAARARRAAFQGPVIGITGSNGKTTVKDLTAALLERLAGTGHVLATRGNLNNHLGVPLTLLRLEAGHRLAVVEMGMNHAGEIRRLAELASPTTGVVLNAGRAHLMSFRSVAGVADAKCELIEALPAGGWAVLNADDARIWARRSRTAARVLSFGVRAGDVRAEAPRLDRAGLVGFRLRLPGGGSVAVRTRLPGLHAASNAAAAAAVAWAHGADARQIAAGLAAFAPRAALRLEWRRLRRGARAIVDCYNANPESCRAAFAYLKAMPAKRRGIVLGGMRELGRHAARAHREIGRDAAAVKPDFILGVGKATAPLIRDIRGTAVPTPLWAVDTDGARVALRRQLRPGTVVLLKASRGDRLERVLERL